MANEPSGSEKSVPAVTPATAATPPTPVAPATPATPAVSAADITATPLPPVPGPVLDTGYTEAGVPTLDGVREKIETRYGTALGATELAEETPEVRTAADQYEARNKAAADKLEEIRASMHKPE